MRTLNRQQINIVLVLALFAVSGGIVYYQRRIDADTLQTVGPDSNYGAAELSFQNYSKRPINQLTVGLLLADSPTAEPTIRATDSKGTVRFPRLKAGYYDVVFFDEEDNELMVSDALFQLRVTPKTITKQTFGQINYPPNQAPNLKITQPAAQEKLALGASYTIRYQFSDPDDPQLTGQLYIQSIDSQSSAPQLLSKCRTITQSTDGSCVWDTAGIKPGSYVIVGRAVDVINEPVSARSSGKITITAPAPILQDVQFVTTRVTQGDTAKLQYSLRDNTLKETTVSFYRDAANKLLLAGSCGKAGLGDLKTCQWNTDTVPAGHYRVFGVTNQTGQQPPLVRAESSNSLAILPATPEKVTGTSRERGLITLSWQDRATGEDGYEIFRATSKDGDYQRVGTTRTTVFGDTRSLESGKKYYYKVRAYTTSLPNNLNSELSTIEEVKAK